MATRQPLIMFAIHHAVMDIHVAPPSSPPARERIRVLTEDWFSPFTGDSWFNYKNKTGVMKLASICTGSVARVSHRSCGVRRTRDATTSSVVVARIHTASRLTNYTDIQTNEKTNRSTVNYNRVLLLCWHVVDIKQIRTVKTLVFYSGEGIACIKLSL